MFPEEEVFINEILSRTINNQDGRGDFIAPIRGGIIYLNKYAEYTEEQRKWLIFVRLHQFQYHNISNKEMKFMNFTFHGEVPPVMEDPEAMDKWGVLRTTTDGQPVDVNGTGLPIDTVKIERKVVITRPWSAEQQQYLLGEEEVVSEYRLAESGWELPEKVLD